MALDDDDEFDNNVFNSDYDGDLICNKDYDDDYNYNDDNNDHYHYYSEPMF